MMMTVHVCVNLIVGIDRTWLSRPLLPSPYPDSAGLDGTTRNGSCPSFGEASYDFHRRYDLHTHEIDCWSPCIFGVSPVLKTIFHTCMELNQKSELVAFLLFGFAWEFFCFVGVAQDVFAIHRSSRCELHI